MIDLSYMNTSVDARGVPGVPSNCKLKDLWKIDQEKLRISFNEGVDVIPVDEDIADVIINALYYASILGLNLCDGKESLLNAEYRLILAISKLYPEVIKKYGWNKRVDSVLKDEK